jgi:hypothetical protein
MFRPFRAPVCGRHQRTQGVALGWDVPAPSGRGPQRVNPGRCPGLVCSGPFGARSPTRVPRALPWAGLFGPLRGEVPNASTQGAALGWTVPAPLGRGPKRAYPGRCPGLDCSGPFGARSPTRVPRALPWAGLFRPLRGEVLNAQSRDAPARGVPLPRPNRGIQIWRVGFVWPQSLARSEGRPRSARPPCRPASAVRSPRGHPC